MSDYRALIRVTVLGGITGRACRHEGAISYFDLKSPGGA